MKRLFFFFFFLPFLATAQSGKVYDNLVVKSRLLTMDRKFAIYLPPDYETSQRSYPVLYLLHGGGDDQTGWVQFGEVQNITDKAIREGTATAMIIVMPDANTGRRGYFNDVKGDWRYEDFFFQELMPFIEKTYRTKQKSATGLLLVFPWVVAVRLCMRCTGPTYLPPLAHSVPPPVRCRWKMPKQT
jgi:enterochelin esterase-like enzyme